MRLRSIVVAVVVPFAIAACAGDGQSPAARPSYDTMPRLSLTPVLELCAGRDDAPCQFTGADIVAAAPDGRVAVGDYRLGELREFDADARFVRAVGRRGAGPGEYRLLVAAGYDSAGHLTIMDQAGFRLQRLDASGRVLHTANASLIPGMADIRIVSGRLATFVLPGAATIGDTVEARVVLLDPATGDTVSLPGLPEPAIATGDGTLMPIQPLFSSHPIGRWAVSPDGALHMADRERLRIVRRDASGAAPRVLVDLDVPPRPVTTGEIEAEVARIAPVGTMNTAMAAAFRRQRDEAVANAATSHPLVSRLVILADGTLLAREGARPGADSVRWNAFTAEGAPLGWLQLPAPARVAGRRLERLLVVSPGTDDVPRMVWYAVR